MENIIKYNSWEDKFPFGALKLNQEFRISLSVNEDYDVKNISWVILKEDQEIERINLIRENKKYYKSEFNGFNDVGIYFYYFEVDVEMYGQIQKRFYGKSIDNADSFEYSYDYINKYQITVYDDYNVPSWYKEGVLYHIFVDRFNNGNRNKKINNTKKNSFIYANWEDNPMYIKDKNGDILRWDFYGGNLKGIIDKLGYLKKLGISIIYLSPIFESSTNHKYAVGDYKKIDSMYGDEDIFKELIEKAKKKGINVILDGVFSHTGADSIYFNKYGRYDELGAYQSEDSKYRNWYKFKADSNEYDCWWGIKDLPNVNELEDSYMDYIIRDKDSVIKKWTNMGVKGWRLDVCDELPTDFIKELKKELKSVDKDTILTGEVWEDASNKVSYNKRRSYLLGKELDSVTGYPFRSNVIKFLKKEITSKQLNERFMEIKENYPKEAFKSNLNLLGTHDVTRIKTELNEDKDLVKVAVGIQMTFEGIPYIYYGDEAGLCGKTDPDNRRTYPWKNEDNDMIEFYKDTVNLRNKLKSLKNGDTEFIKTKNDDVFSFMRYTKDEKTLVVINRSQNKQSISLNLEFDKIQEIYSNIEENKNLEYTIIKNKEFELEVNGMEIKIFNII